MYPPNVEKESIEFLNKLDVKNVTHTTWLANVPTKQKNLQKD